MNKKQGQAETKYRLLVLLLLNLLEEGSITEEEFKDIQKAVCKKIQAHYRLVGGGRLKKTITPIQMKPKVKETPPKDRLFIVLNLFF